MGADPMGYRRHLPLSAGFSPLGFPLRLSTNSEAVLRAAEASWSGYPDLFSGPALTLEVAVEPDESEAPPRPPVYFGREHVFVISGGEDSAVCDHTRQFACCRLSQRTAAETAFTSYYYLEAIAYHLLTQLRVTPIHAACVSRGGFGILLCGDSGAGKSSLAYACARAGWRYVSDNNSWLVRDDPRRTILGDPRRIRFRENAPDLFPEIRGRAPLLYCNGKMSMSLDTLGLDGAHTTQVSHVVFLERGGNGGLRSVDKQAAFERLMSSVPLYAPAIQTQHERSIRSLVQADTVSLGYGHFEEAIEILECNA